MTSCGVEVRVWRQVSFHPFFPVQLTGRFELAPQTFKLPLATPSLVDGGCVIGVGSAKEVQSLSCTFVEILTFVRERGRIGAFHASVTRGKHSSGKFPGEGSADKGCI